MSGNESGKRHPEWAQAGLAVVAISLVVGAAAVSTTSTATRVGNLLVASALGLALVAAAVYFREMTATQGGRTALTALPTVIVIIGIVSAGTIASPLTFVGCMLGAILYVVGVRPYLTNRGAKGAAATATEPPRPVAPPWTPGTPSDTAAMAEALAKERAQANEATGDAAPPDAKPATSDVAADASPADETPGESA